MPSLRLIRAFLVTLSLAGAPAVALAQDYNPCVSTGIGAPPPPLPANQEQPPDQAVAQQRAFSHLRLVNGSGASHGMVAGAPRSGTASSHGSPHAAHGGGFGSGRIHGGGMHGGHGGGGHGHGGPRA